MMFMKKTLDSRDIKIISFSITIVGLIILYGSISSQTERFLSIEDIENSDIEQKIITCGRITSKRIIDNGCFIKINDNDEQLDIVFFDLPDNIDMKDIDDHICIEGTLNRYDGDIQLIGSRIIDIDVSREK